MGRSSPEEKRYVPPHRRESLPTVNVESTQISKPPSRAAHNQYSNIQQQVYDPLAPSVPRYMPPHKRAQLSEYLSISHNVTNPHCIPTIALYVPSHQRNVKSHNPIQSESGSLAAQIDRSEILQGWPFHRTHC